MSGRRKIPSTGSGRTEEGNRLSGPSLFFSVRPEPVEGFFSLAFLPKISGRRTQKLTERHARPFSLALALALLALAAWASDGSATVEAYLASTAEQLPEPARGALRRIDDAPRQLLAVRSYLRAADTLVERWSWSEEQIRSFASSAEYRELLEEVARVRAAFEAQNPGYSLGAGTQARSLDVQLERWNENAGVGRVAQSLYSSAMAELKAGAYPAVPTAEAVTRFAKFLRAWRPRVAAPLAAPGLSLHGQLRAVDFHVEKAGRIVAGTQIVHVRSVWERQGWGRKLRRAVGDSRFIGPLQSPNEPWHYEYVERSD